MWMRPPRLRAFNYSYKLAFDYTNNEVKYVAMILVILSLKEIQVKSVELHGDSELIIKQMTGEYHTRHPRMRS